jgi:hypothetical protein
MINGLLPPSDGFFDKLVELCRKLSAVKPDAFAVPENALVAAMKASAAEARERIVEATVAEKALKDTQATHEQALDRIRAEHAAKLAEDRAADEKALAARTAELDNREREANGLEQDLCKRDLALDRREQDLNDRELRLNRRLQGIAAAMA